MMDAVYVVTMLGLFLVSIFGLGLFTRGQGQKAGREE